MSDGIPVRHFNSDGHSHAAMDSPYRVSLRYDGMPIQALVFIHDASVLKHVTGFRTIMSTVVDSKKKDFGEELLISSNVVGKGDSHDALRGDYFVRIARSEGTIIGKLRSLAEVVVVAHELCLGADVSAELPSWLYASVSLLRSALNGKSVFDASPVPEPRHTFHVRDLRNFVIE